MCSLRLAVAAVADPEDLPQEGAVIGMAGQYTIINMLGRGGMAVVYEAEEANLIRADEQSHATVGSVLSSGDIRDWGSFAGKLQSSADALSAYLRSKLSIETNETLAKWSSSTAFSESMQRQLLDDLNRILNKESFGEEEQIRYLLTSLDLGPLSSDSNKPSPRPRLNRLLFNAAFAESVGNSGPRLRGRSVALKLLRVGRLADRTDIARFHDEANALREIDHANVVPIYSTGEHAGRQFLTMKLLRGGTLRDRVPELIRKPREAIRILLAVTRGLHAVHSAGIIHRDLTAQNILFDEVGSPYIADFGIAHFADRTSGHTSTDLMPGTPEYTAPERLSGSKITLVTVDIWSMGVLLYLVLSGGLPFTAESKAGVIARVLKSEPSPLPRSVSRDLRSICMKCLQVDARKRYQSADALAEDLNNWLTGSPVHARPIGLLERLVKWVKQNPWKAAFSGTVVAAIVAPFSVAVTYVLMVNYLRGSHFVYYFQPSGSLEMRLQSFGGPSWSRCTENFDASFFRAPGKKVRFEVIGVPEPVAMDLRFVIRSDWAGLPDPIRGQIVRSGDVISLSVPNRKLLADVFFYFTNELWPKDYRSEVPANASVRMTVVP